MSVGSRLRILREKRGWTQIQAAEKLGISSQVISNYERDYRSPDSETLLNIALTYQCSLDWLIGVTEKQDLAIEKNPSSSYTLNIAFFGGPKVELSEEEAWHLKESLEMYRALKAKRVAEKKKSPGK